MVAEDSLLGGYRVLDLTDEKGLWCARLLGDFGADVIKIEVPGGDLARNIPPFYKDSCHAEKSLFWFFFNLNKRGITLNINSEEGRDIFKRLVRGAHFVVESFEPGYMKSMGLDYHELTKINSGIIMTSITPFGQSGPYAHYKASDIVCTAMGGVMRLHGDGDRAPVRISQPQAFFQGCLQAAIGIVMAHYHRELTGKGQYVDVSIQEAVVLTAFYVPEYWEIAGLNVRSQGVGYAVSRAKGPLYQRVIYPCQDGYVHFFWGGGANKAYLESTKSLVRIANEEGKLLEIKDYDWASFDSNQIEQEEYDRISHLFEVYLLNKTRDELMACVIKAGRLLLSPINTIKEVFNNPQLKQREFWLEVEHPELGERITYPGAPLKLSHSPWRVYRHAPFIGEHNEDIYIGELGLSKEELTLLRARGII